MGKRKSIAWIPRAAACLAAVLVTSPAGPVQAQSVPIPAAIVTDAADQLVGQAQVGPAGFVSVLLEVDGVLAQFEVVQNGPESQVVWFDDNDCFGSPYMSPAGVQSLAIMVGTQFAVAGGDPAAANSAMTTFNTYSSGTGTGTATTTKSVWSMATGCEDLAEGFEQAVVAASPVTTNPFATMSRPFKVVKPAATLVVEP